MNTNSGRKNSSLESELIKESENKYQTLVENSPDAIVIYVEGKIVFVNNEGFRLMATDTPEELIGKTGLQFIHPEYREKVIQRMKEVAMEGVVLPYMEEKFIRLDGSVVDVEVKAISIRFNNKPAVQLIIRDITERKRAEEALIKSEEKYRSLFENVQDVFFETNLEGTILEISPSIKYFSDFNRDELLGTSIFKLYSNPKDRDILLNTITSLGELRDYELKLKTKTGQLKYVSINAQLIFDPDGRPNCIDGSVRDITERKLTETALNESEIKYRLLFTNNPQPSWIYDLETLSFLEVNEAAINHYGYSKEEFLSMTLKDIRPVEDIPSLLDDVKQTYKPYNNAGVWRHLRKNGELILVEIISHSIIYNGRKARHVLVHDVTKQKKAEDALIESRQQFLDIIDFLPDATFVVDNEKRVIAWNKAIEVMTGVPKSDMIGKGDHIYAIPFYGKKQNLFLDLMDHHDEELNARYQNIGREGFSIYAEIFAPALYDGKGAYISVLGAPLFNKNAERVGSIESIRDITEIKQAGEALVKLKKAINNSGEAIFMTDLQGIFTFVNPSFVSLYGFTPEEVIGKTTPRIIKSGVLDQSVYDYFWQTLLSKSEVREEIINKKKDGTLINIESSSTPILNKEKNIIGFLGIQRDITERKQAEQELVKAKEKAEESDRLKSAFLANVSHEIRTPMNGILGFAELLKEPGLTGDDQQEYIRIIEKSGERMLNIIKDIVDISKIEAGQTNVEISETNVNEKIEFVYTFFKPEAENKGVHLCFNNGLPFDKAIINTDSEKLFSILSNLVKNAIKYTHTGSIEFGYNIAEPLHATSLLYHSYLQFFVKDTGIGIPKDRQQAIFDRFVQADIADKQAYQGAGLGLSISKAYVEMLGGKIWVESDPEDKSGETGTTFYFTIPYRAQPEEKAGAKKVASSDSTVEPYNAEVLRLKILIVEDDEMSALFLKKAIKSFGKELLSAGTGVEAIEAIRKNPDIDLILMDIKLPDLNGYNATKQIRQFNENVIIFAQTAFALAGDKEKAIEAGCNEYISKPIKPAKVKELIEKYFKKN